MAKNNTDVLDKLFFSSKKSEDETRYMETTGLCYDHRVRLEATGMFDRGCGPIGLSQTYACPKEGCKRRIYAKPSMEAVKAFPWKQDSQQR